MRQFWRAVWALVWKDLLLEVRSKEVLTPVAVFALLVVALFNFLFGARPGVAAAVAPGVLWASLTFAAALGLGRSFALEREKGALDGLLLCPVGREALYTGKLLAIFLLLTGMEVLLLPLFALFFNLPFLTPAVWGVVLLATLGLSAVGVLLSAMAAATRAREVLLPVLLFPLLLPVIIGAVEATGSLWRGTGETARWVGLTAAFDALFLVLGATLFGFVLEE